MNRLFKVSGIMAVFLCFGGVIYAADSNEFGQLLNKIKTYDFSQSRADLIKVSGMIHQASGKPEMKDIERQLDDFLKSNATYAAKDFVCRELSVSGSEASVPALAQMLADEKLSDMARFALERIPGEAVNEALRKALPKASGNAKVGIIDTLGVRGDKKSVALLAGLIAEANETTAGAAAAALGRIDDPVAVETLVKAKDKATGGLRTRVVDAYLQQAGRLVAKGQKDAASVIYKQLYAASEPMPVRVAAVRGMIFTAGDKAGEVIVEMLKSTDKPIQTAAIATLKDVAKTDVIKAAAEQLPNLAASQQVQLLVALTDCNDRVALPAVLTATKNANESVRIAALNAIGVLGDASMVDVLAQTAASTGGEEQKAAQNSLYRLRGGDVDRAILSRINQAEPKVKVELIRSCEQRNIGDSTKVLMNAATDADGGVRIESIKALRAVAEPQAITGIIELQLAASGAERSELEKTVAAVARKIPEDKGRAEKVLAALPSAKDLDARCSLLSVLGKIGDPAALPVLREAIGDKEDKVKDAAVRALSDWPTAAPAEDLLKVAQTSDNQVHRILALRGYVRLAGLESKRPAEETIKMYKEAMTLAPNADEKRMVLSGVANARSFEALQMAASCLDVNELRQEAEAAVTNIAEATIQKHPSETKELLQKVLAGTPTDSVREQAQRLLKQGK
ncbi:MAG: HEAT repeat domain-containing protein [Sedimentisphaerales bacterium]|jgi:HEAT repeat protein